MESLIYPASVSTSNVFLWSRFFTDSILMLYYTLAVGNHGFAYYNNSPAVLLRPGRGLRFHCGGARSSLAINVTIKQTGVSWAREACWRTVFMCRLQGYKRAESIAHPELLINTPDQCKSPLCFGFISGEIYTFTLLSTTGFAFPVLTLRWDNHKSTLHLTPQVSGLFV